MSVSELSNVKSTRNSTETFHPQILQIARAALALALFVKQGNHREIIMSGKSSIFSRALFTTAWRTLFPKLSMPRLHIFDKEGNDLLYKNLKEGAGERPVLAQKYIDRKLPDLSKVKGEKICYIDDFSAKGEKYAGLREIFKKLGFRNLTFAFFTARDYTDLGKDAFVAERDTSVTNSLFALTQAMYRFPDVFDQRTPEQQKLQFKKTLGNIIKAIRALGERSRSAVI